MLVDLEQRARGVDVVLDNREQQRLLVEADLQLLLKNMMVLLGLIVVI